MILGSGIFFELHRLFFKHCEFDKKLTNILQGENFHFELSPSLDACIERMIEYQMT